MLPPTIFRIGLGFFLVAALIGTLLRWAFVEEVSWLHYRYWVHAHSHVAMLGWLYLALFALMVRVFAGEKAWKYGRLAVITGLSVAGMMIAFPVEGYGTWSITFSVLHSLLSYVFVFRLWKDQKATGLARLFLQGSLIFLVVSTLALWSMPVILTQGLQGKAIYYMAVQFYLHFQFNGWFTFACLALFFHWAASAGTEWPVKNGRLFFLLLAISCLLTYALSIAWSNPGPLVFGINSMGVVCQLVALLYFFGGLKKVHHRLRRMADGWTRVLLGVAFGAFITRILIQSVVFWPAVATISFTIRNFVLGFIHLILLGTVTFFVLAYARRTGLVLLDRGLATWGLVLLLSGFAGSEALLFLQGLLIWMGQGFIPFYHESLFAVSVLLPLGVALILYAQFLPKNNPPAREAISVPDTRQHS